MPKTITKKIAKNPIKAKAGKNVFAGVSATHIWSDR